MIQTMKLNIHLYFFRGNHDNPEYFENEEIKSHYQEILSSVSDIKDNDIPRRGQF